MKRTNSNTNLCTLENKKRKIQLAPIRKIQSLKCDICKEDVKHYGQCISAFIYCSEDCLEILTLRQINKLEKNSFEEEDDMNI